MQDAGSNYDDEIRQIAYGFGKRKDARTDVKLSTGLKLRRYGWKNIAQKMGLKRRPFGPHVQREIKSVKHTSPQHSSRFSIFIVHDIFGTAGAARE